MSDEPQPGLFEQVLRDVIAPGEAGEKSEQSDVEHGVHHVEGRSVAVPHTSDKLQFRVPVHVVETRFGAKCDIGHASASRAFILLARRISVPRQEVIVEIISQASIAARIALLVGTTPMLLGIAFALRPNERWLALMRPLSLAGIFATVSNLFLGLANALHALASNNAGDASGIQFAAVWAI